MDKESPEAVRIDPPITVEAAEPEPLPEPARRPGCAHRLTWRELTVPAKYRTGLFGAFAVVQLAVASWLIIDGATTLRDAIAEVDFFRLAFGFFTLATGVLLPVGAVAFLRLWKLPHSPGLTAFILHNTALCMLGIVSVASGNEWLALALLPVFALMQELGKFRLVLTDRASCAADRTMPLPLRIRRKGGLEFPVDDIERAYVLGPREILGDFDSWNCPHLLTWEQSRRSAKIRAMLEEAASHLYELGLFATVVAVLRNTERLPIPLPAAHHTLAAIVTAAAVGILHISLRRVLSVGPLRHFAIDYPTSYTVAFAAVVSAAALAGWTAFHLDRPYLWLMVPLALVFLYSLVENLVTNTPISQCKARPELHPIVQSWKKA